MALQDKKWIIRDQTGHIYGPFTIAKLGELITKGILTGDEEVASYPAGDWAPLSSEKELYELVLQAISAARPKKTTNKIQPTSQKFSNQQVLKEEGSEPVQKAEIKSRKLTPKKTSDAVAEIQNSDKTTGSQHEESLSETKSEPGFSNAISPPDLEMSDRQQLKKRRGNLIPIIFLLLAALIFYISLTASKKGSEKNQPLSLLAPKMKKGGSQAKSAALLQQGWGYFYKDTPNNYLRAEELFVSAVEEAPTHSDALLMLLYTDSQLWPYAKQDGNDQNVLQNILQMLSKADLYGPKRAMGQAIVDLLLGRDTTAKSQIRSGLIAQPTDGRLYQLKAQTFLLVSDYNQAIAYYEKAATLIPHWVYPIYMLGFCYNKLGNVNVASQYFSKALQMNTNHANARLELGILESRYFGHDDLGRGYITVALDSGERFVAAAEARAHYTLALIHNKMGDRPRSKAEAEKSLRLDPSNPDVREFLSRLGGSANIGSIAGGDRQHLDLGDQYFRQNNFLGAQAQYKAAFQANPKNARAALRAGESLWKIHQSTEAIHYLELAISADKRMIEAYVTLADYKSQRFDFDSSVRALETAIKVDPKNYEIYRGYAELFLRRADAGAAEMYAERALKLYETDVKLNEIMSRVQLAKKNIVKAMQYAKRAVELDPSNASAQVNFGKMKAAYEGVKDAADYLKNLIDTYPSQLAYRIGFADVLIQDEQYSAAIQVLEQITAADDMNKEAFISLGDAQFLSGRFEDALGSFLSAARIDPSDPIGLFRAGEVYFKGSKFSEAEKQFQLVLRITPLFPRAHYNLARSYQSLGLGDLALKELDEEKRLNPKLADPYEFSGDLYMASRKFSLAAREYQLASQIKPQDASIFVKLAKAYRGQGSVDASFAMLRLAAARESGYAEIYREYGLAYEAKGMAEQAVTSFEQYLKLEPNAADKAEILGKIKELE